MNITVGSTFGRIMFSDPTADKGIETKYFFTRGKHMKKMLTRLWKDESAQGATEYILMLVIVVAIALTFRRQIQSIVEGKVSDLGGKIQSFE